MFESKINKHEGPVSNIILELVDSFKEGSFNRSDCDVTW